jgi:shikimate 5-dehydrogenase
VGGFLSPLRNRFDLRGARAAIVGAGGAARAVAVALASAGAAVTVYARNTSRAEEVARIVGGAGLALPVPPRSWDLLVNATPVGLTPNVDDTPHAGPFDGRLAYDLVYNPQDTRFLKDAHAAGCDTVGGLEMLVAQAENQFEWWTSRRPASGLMREAARARLRLDSPHEVASAKSS